MAFVLETGAGTPNANAYATPAFVTSYLTDQGRELDWVTQALADQQAAIVIATSYIDKRHEPRLKGERLRDLISGRAAKGLLTPAGNPSDGETVTIGQIVYRFVNTLAQENDVLIGADLDASLTNLENATLAQSLDTTVHEDTRANFEACGKAQVSPSSFLVTAQAEGTNGNEIVFATTLVGATISGSGTLESGLDEGPQPLAVPRRGMTDLDGNVVNGVPLKFKQATAEYALRSLTAELAPDPTADTSGVPIQRRREKVGPIEEEFEFVSGGVIRIFRPYPAADRLLVEFLKSTTGVIR